MPIYEFYCPACHTVFNFFSSVVDTRSRPDCPKCKRPRLERKPSSFATRSGGAGDDVLPPGVDEGRLESALESMAGELEGLGEGAEDPRTVAQLFRRMGESAGLEPGPALERMLERLEAGDDPEALDGDLESELDEHADPADLFRARKRAAPRPRRPRVDGTLYFL